jgi:hypothetical protein
VSQAPMETWPTVDEAAARLETSRRTIFRYGTAQEIEIRKRAGKTVCNPTDIERLKPATHIMPEGTRAVALAKPQSSAAAPATSNGWAAMLQVIDRFIQET